jgi:hypothetical protein
MAEHFEDRLIQDLHQDAVPGWEAPDLPVRVPPQLEHLAATALDPLRGGMEAAAQHLGATTAACLRFLGETAALMQWLVDDPDPRERQLRAFRLQRSWISAQAKMIRRIAEREPHEARRLADEASVKELESLEQVLLKVASAEGFRHVGMAPSRREIFDRYLKVHGGYGFFSLMSQLGSHPGFMSMPEGPIARAYLCRGLVSTFKQIVAIIATEFEWELADELGASLFAFDALAGEIDKRWMRHVWGEQDSYPAADPSWTGPTT